MAVRRYSAWSSTTGMQGRQAHILTASVSERTLETEVRLADARGEDGRALAVRRPGEGDESEPSGTTAAGRRRSPSSWSARSETRLPGAGRRASLLTGFQELSSPVSG